MVLAPHARQLVGVDLSAKMLEKARARNLYDRLEQLDLLTMMQGEGAASYDVLFAADVFVYLGKLDELVEQARRLLRPSGLFAFSVESLDALAGDAAALPDRRDYKLNVTARYAHSMAYLTRMAGDYGFDVLSTTGTQHRLRQGQAGARLSGLVASAVRLTGPTAICRGRAEPHDRPLHSREDEPHDFLDEVRSVAGVLQRPSKRVGELGLLVEIETMLRTKGARPLDNPCQPLHALRRILLSSRTLLDRQQMPDVGRDLVAKSGGRTTIEPSGQHCFLPRYKKRAPPERGPHCTASNCL